MGAGGGGGSKDGGYGFTGDWRRLAVNDSDNITTESLYHRDS